MCDAMMLLVGKGNLSLHEARRMKDMGLLQLILDGQSRRDHIPFEAARMVVSPWLSEKIEFPWDNENSKTPEEIEAEIEAKRPMLEAKLKAYLEQQKQNKQNTTNNGKE